MPANNDDQSAHEIHDRVPGASVPGSGWTPIPDPTRLTDEAIARATAVFHREIEAARALVTARMDGMEATSAQRMAFLTDAQNAIRADRERDIAALRDVLFARLDDAEKATDQRLAAYNLLPGNLRAERHGEIAGLRELIEARLAGMDAAVELLAQEVNKTPSATDKALSAAREVIEQRFTDLDKARDVARQDAETDRERIRREMEAKAIALRELVEQRLDLMDTATRLLADNVKTIPMEIDKSGAAVKQIIETRLAGMDEATRLLASNVDKVPYAILQEAGNLKALIFSKIEDVSHTNEEKFAAVDALFASNALALTAALAAQEKAVAEQNKSNTLAITKSEVSTKETIAANAAQTQTGLRGLEQTFADLKERVVRIESTGAGASVSRIDAREDRNEHKLSTAQMLQTVALFVIGLGVVISLIALVLHK